MPNIYIRPDEVELKDIVSNNKDFYSSRDTQMLYWNDLYERRYEGYVKLPTGVEPHKSSRAMRMVDNLRDQIRTDKPLVEALADGTSQKAEREKDLRQMWGQAELVRSSHEGLVDPWVQGAGDLLLRGASGIKTIVQPESLMSLRRQDDETPRQFEMRKKKWDKDLMSRSHFITKAVDPLLLYPSPGIGGLRYMIERQRRRVLDVVEQFEDFVPSKEHLKDMLTPVEYIEFWSWIFDPKREEWVGSYIVEIDKQRVREEANPYRAIPYTFRYSGLGRMNEDGDPAKLAIGVLHGISGEIEGEVAMKTALLMQAMFHVFPRLVVKGEKSDVVAKAMRVGPGAVIEIPNQPTSDLKWLETSQLNPHQLDLLNRFESSIGRIDNPALTGEKTADYGIHQALQVGQALKVSVGRVKDSLDVMGAQSLELKAHLQAHFGLDSTVHSTWPNAEQTRNIKAEQLRDAKFGVSFEAVDPAENDRKMLSLAGIKRDPGTISRKTFRDVALRDIVKSNEEEEAQILAEQIQDAMVASGGLLPIVMQQVQALQENRVAQQAAEVAGDRASAAAEIVADRSAAVEGLAGEGTTTVGEQVAAEQRGNAGA